MVEICGCGHYMFPLPEGVNYCNNEDNPGWGKSSRRPLGPGWGGSRICPVPAARAWLFPTGRGHLGQCWGEGARPRSWLWAGGTLGHQRVRTQGITPGLCTQNFGSPGRGNGGSSAPPGWHSSVLAEARAVPKIPPWPSWLYENCLQTVTVYFQFIIKLSECFAQVSQGRGS